MKIATVYITHVNGNIIEVIYEQHPIVLHPFECSQKCLAISRFTNIVGNAVNRNRGKQFYPYNQNTPAFLKYVGIPFSFNNSDKYEIDCLYYDEPINVIFESLSIILEKSSIFLGDKYWKY